MKLTFHGGAGAVTGSNYLFELGKEKILVDCGLYQGSHFAERQNFEPFPYDPKEIQAVFVTHAHIDHTGRLPRLYKDGFRGKVYSTAPTKDFAELLLIDSEHILAKEAEREGKLPLCTVADVESLMKMWEGVGYHEPIRVGNFTVEFYNAGHVLGSASVKVEAEGKGVVVSGDLGNSPAPIIPPTEPLPETDYCLIESAYGDRAHEGRERRREDLEDAVEDAVRAGGVLMIPAFALERTQELLYHLDRLFGEGRIPRVPVFFDSPLAIKLTAVYKKHENYFNREASAMVRSGDDILNFPGLRLTLTTEQSKEINDVPPPKIIIAGSGMSNGGRILHHERRYLSDPKSTLLFVSYQAVGSLGRQILDGAKSVKIFGEKVPVRCKKKILSSYSAHADQPRLLRWLAPRRATLKKVFVVQGDLEASAVLAQKIRDDLAVEAVVPQLGDEAVL